MAVAGNGRSFRPATRLFALILAVLALGAGAPRLQAQTAPVPVALPDHTLPVLSHAAQLATAPTAAAQPLRLTFVLKRDDEAGFQSFLSAVDDPNSPQFRHYLTQQQLADRFGPTQAQFDHVKQYLTQQGFTFESGAESRLTLSVRGTRAQTEQALNVGVHDYRLGSRSFFANDRDPALPSDVAADVRSIAGLTNFPVPQHSPGPHPAANPATGSAPQPYAPMSIATAYDAGALGSGINGAGQKIGLLEYDSFLKSDVASWLVLEGLPATQISQLSIDDINGPTTPTEGNGTGEVLLDIDTAMGVAPGAQYVAYVTGNGVTSFQDMLTAMIDDHDTEISVSWFYCESQTSLGDVQGIDSIVQGATASGIGVFAATDDTGNSCNTSADIAVPADGPHVTAVGGTSLYVNTGNAYSSETYWNDGGSGGFGTSAFFSAPSYQSPLSGNGSRTVPDVSADGDPATGIEVCQATLVNVSGMVGGCPDGFTSGSAALWGGTSMATPIWAAGMALINQKLGHLTGNINTTLYPLHAGKAFHPAAGMSTDFAHVGLGSFDLGQLYTALSGGLTSCSGAGFSTQPSGSVTLGQPLSWTALATGCSGAQYEFWLNTNGQWSSPAQQPYGSAGTYAVTPAAAGTYSVEVWVRATGSGAVYEAYADSNPVQVGGAACTGAQFSAQPAATVALGQPLSWTATAAGCSGAQYQFWLRSNGSWGSGPAQAYSSNNSFSVTPSLAGSYLVEVWVRAAGATAAYQAYSDSGTVQVGSAACSSVHFTGQPGASSNAGQQLTWMATAAGCASPQYQFWVYAAGSWGSAPVQAYGSSGTFRYTPLTGGTYFVEVWARQSGSSAGFEAFADSSAVQVTGSTLTVSSAGCGQTAPSGTINHVSGDAISIAATPCDGLHTFSGWTITGATCAAGASTSPCTFTMPGGNVTVSASFVGPAAMLTPAPNSTLPGTSVTFTWSAGTGAVSYWLQIGRSRGGTDYYSQQLSGLSTTVSGLPADGSLVYVRLFQEVGSTWQYIDYVYTAS